MSQNVPLFCVMCGKAQQHIQYYLTLISMFLQELSYVIITLSIVLISVFCRLGKMLTKADFMFNMPAKCNGRCDGDRKDRCALPCLKYWGNENKPRCIYSNHNPWKAFYKYGCDPCKMADWDDCWPIKPPAELFKDK